MTLTQKGRFRLFYASIPNDFSEKQKSQFDLVYMKSVFKAGFSAGLAGQYRETPVTPVLAGR